MLIVFCRYLRMVVWPGDLSVYYTVPLHRYPDLAVIMATLFLAALAWLIVRLYRHNRPLAFWPLFFFIGLLPVSQIVPLVTMMNDRYLYFPMIGAGALVAHGVGVLAKSSRLPAPLAVVLPAVPVLLLALGSVQRVPVWRDAVTLWEDTVRKVPGFYQAWEALGESYQYYNAAPDYEKAKEAFKRALQLCPDNDISRYNLGVAYTEQRDYVSADATFRELLRRSPRNVMGWAAYGELASRQSQYGEAEQRYLKALELQPDAEQVQRKLGNLLVVMNRLDDALSVYLRLDGLQKESDPATAYELARVEALRGDTGGAVAWLERALQRGYADYAGIMNDPELMPVRSDGRFADLVRRYFPGGR